MRKSTIRKDSRRKSSVRRRSKRYFVRAKQPKMSARTKWRALIHKVINNLGWIVEKPTGRKTLDEKKDETEVITQYDKFLLFKDPMDRREDDLLSLANRISAYKAFRKYNMSLRVSLLKKARYLAYTKSVIMVRQGMYLNNVYVLVKGSGTAIREVWVDGMPARDVSNMREGQLFGEYPLLYDKPSMTTIATEGPSEWIIFNKHYFLLYAKDELKRQYYDVECAMRKFSFFDKLTFFEMREYCVAAEIIKVEQNVVLSLFEGTVGLTYFILEGKCNVLQKVVLVKDPALPYPGYKLHPDQETKDPNAEKFIIRTCFLTRRGVFGLGEEACRWVVVTDTESSLMVIPRYMLLKYGRNMVWERLKDQLNTAYPSLDLILNQFNERKRWSRYKHRFTRSLTRNLSGNDIHNVPLLTRCNEITSADEDEAIKEIKTSKKSEKFLRINVKSTLKKLELYPLLKLMAEYLPKDEIY